MKLEEISLLRRFVSPQQMTAILSGTRGEEGAYFRAKVSEMASVIANMPKTYEQDGMDDKAIVSLHYFSPSADWYITEKDAETPDEPGQHQAFGLADLGYGGELGYISIVELIRHSVELDLHFAPVTIGELQAKREAA